MQFYSRVVLCLSGTLGKGTLHTYPGGRFQQQGVDGSGDDGGCGDNKCDSGSSGNGNSDGSSEATKTMAATAMAVGGNTTIN